VVRAREQQAGQLPGGVAAVVVRGLSRARIGLGLPGTGTALWVQIEPVEDPPEPSERALELAREVRAVMENVLEHRGASQIAESLRAVTDPGRRPRIARTAPCGASRPYRI